MTSTQTFISVGNYLAAPVLISISLTVLGLSIWSRCFPKVAESDDRPIALALSVILATHIHGYMVLNVWNQFDLSKAASPLLLCFLVFNYLIFSALVPNLLPTSLQLPLLLKSFALLLAGMILAVVSTLNFSLGSLIAIILAPPLITTRSKRYPVLFTIPLVFLLMFYSGMDLQKLIIEWYIVKTWFIPFSTTVVLPILTQANIVALL